MEMIEGLKTCKDKVREIMEKYPVTRDSDKLLWLAYMVKHHGLREKLGNTAYEVLKEVFMSEETPAMESIRRVRQKIQEQELQGKLMAERLEQSSEVEKWALKKHQAPTFQLQL